MSRFYCLLLYMGFVLHAMQAGADNDSVPAIKKLRLKGYVKQMQQASFSEHMDQMETGNLIHNRLNLQYNFSPNCYIRTDIRNRIFYGEMVRMNPGFASLLKNPNDYLNLTKTWFDKNALILHSVIDRAYIDFAKGKWDFSAGRQRTNWGINTLWTPNDIFNTYNFFDFDYEERPGSDGIRIQYAPTGFSAVELAYKAGRRKDEHIGALLYRFNRWQYDFQAFGGMLNADATAGLGWAGNIKDAGFKGETTILIPALKQATDTAVGLLSTFSADYVFKGGWYVNGSFLYNRSGAEQLSSIAGFYLTRIRLRNLMPFKYSWSILVNKSLTPVLGGSAVVIYSTASNACILIPSITYSLAENWDIYLTGQLFFAQKNSTYGTLGNTLYLRFKMSF